MEGTDKNDLMNPDSTVEIQIEHSENDYCNENKNIILNKTDSVKSVDDIALETLHASIEETAKALNSAGKSIRIIVH